jgi:hypothetical protein
MSVYNQITVTYNNKLTLLTPYGRQFEESDNLKMREDEAADGTTHRDIIAWKKVFTLSYDIVNKTFLNFMTDLLLSPEPVKLSIQGYDELYGREFLNEYNVLLQPFSRSRLLAVKGGLYSGFTAEFREV